MAEKSMKRFGSCVALLVLCWSGAAFGWNGIAEKKVFEMPTYTTVGGKTIRNLRVGYESYGTLNADGSNAILICQFFSGNSHAAGRYSAEDKSPGYWDDVIGDGKPFDTSKYFVLSVDTLANLNVRDPNTVTTGPASIDPETGKPYGMRFPVVTIEDFVHVQKALADRLGIRRFHAVAGASMGSMQAMQWAASYPDMVQRAIPVIAVGLDADPYLVATMQLWSAPIRLDRNWNNGDYYGAAEPVEGLAAAMSLVTVGARSPAWARAQFGRRWADNARDPGAAFDNRYAIEAGVEAMALDRARQYDANAFLYLAKAVQLYDITDILPRVRASTLWLAARSDLLTLPEYIRRALEPMQANRTPVQFYEIEGDGGHVDGIVQIGTMSETLRIFLED
jgi:homoserine O-acetyltransferase/O-succinyltransferase